MIQTLAYTRRLSSIFSGELKGSALITTTGNIECILLQCWRYRRDAAPAGILPYTARNSFRQHHAFDARTGIRYAVHEVTSVGWSLETHLPPPLLQGEIGWHVAARIKEKKGGLDSWGLYLA